MTYCLFWDGPYWTSKTMLCAKWARCMCVACIWWYFGQLGTRKELIKCVKESKQQRESIRHTHKRSATWRRASDACDGQTRDYDEKKNNMHEDSVLFRVSSSLFWFVYMSLVRVAFIYHSNRTRVRLEADRDPSFQRSQSACLVRTRVQMAAFRHVQMNRTNRAIAPGFV